MEATARKPGNVHPEASFADLTYADFLAAAAETAPVLAQAAETGVGRTIRWAVERTVLRTGSNVNLGMILLLAPLAAVPQPQSLKQGIGPVLQALTQADADEVYQAIRRARPGGMGQVAQEDVTQTPQVTLLEAMRLAAGRDRVAAQYATDFRLVLDEGVPFLAAEPDLATDWEPAVIRLYLHLLAGWPDTLIARKCGSEVAAEAAQRARRVIDCGGPATEPGRRELETFDVWLRADGHRRNPGTTADLVAATLFAGFRDGRLPLPKPSTFLRHPVLKEVFP